VSSLALALELFSKSRISLSARSTAVNRTRFHLSVTAILTSDRCDTLRQVSTGILLHYENLFGLHRCRESFLD